MSQESKIAEMKLKGDLSGLVKIIKNDDEWMSRMDAAEALAQLGDKRGINYLINALENVDADMRDVAREILEGLNEPRGNQALQKSRKLTPERFQSDNRSENLIVNETKITKETRSLSKRRQRNEKSLSRRIIITLAVAGTLIFIDSFSWSSGGMNGIGSLIIVVVTAIVLLDIFLRTFTNYPAQPKRNKPWIIVFGIVIAMYFLFSNEFGIFGIIGAIASLVISTIVHFIRTK